MFMYWFNYPVNQYMVPVKGFKSGLNLNFCKLNLGCAICTVGQA